MIAAVMLVMLAVGIVMSVVVIASARRGRMSRTYLCVLVSCSCLWNEMNIKHYISDNEILLKINCLIYR